MAPNHIHVTADPFDGRAVITNPIINPRMKGGHVPDYKATCQQLATQLLAEQSAHANTHTVAQSYSTTIDKLYSERGQASVAITKLKHHWTSIFWPKSIWAALDPTHTKAAK